MRLWAERCNLSQVQEVAYGLIQAEWQRTQDALTAITGDKQRLAHNEALARSITNKMLHGTLAELHAADGAEREHLAETVSRLFLRNSTRNPGGEGR